MGGVNHPKLIPSVLNKVTHGAGEWCHNRRGGVVQVEMQRDEQRVLQVDEDAPGAEGDREADVVVRRAVGREREVDVERLLRVERQAGHITDVAGGTAVSQLTLSGCHHAAATSALCP